MSIDSSIFNAKLVVNRITNFEYYIYMYIDFNQNMITDFVNTTDNISITNLNTFTNFEQLENFNLHPISNGYNILYSESLNIKSKFNNLTSYYNLATNVNKNGLFPLLCHMQTHS
jgi:hypothetical protein